MKLLVYNIAYGTGNPGSEYGRLFTSHRYLTTPEYPFRRIVNFIEESKPDVVGLIEADLGSPRTRGINQAEVVAERLGHSKFYMTKYDPHSPMRLLPYLKHQGNAILSQNKSKRSHMFMPRGTKKLVISSKINGVNFILLHLALTKRARLEQLKYVAESISAGTPTVVAGDLNTFSGATELTSFLDHTNLRNANKNNLSTYPAWNPIKQLDYILVSPEIKVTNFEVPSVGFSDHLPVLAELELR